MNFFLTDSGLITSASEFPKLQFALYSDFIVHSIMGHVDCFLDFGHHIPCTLYPPSTHGCLHGLCMPPYMKKECSKHYKKTLLYWMENIHFLTSNSGVVGKLPHHEFT